MRSGTLPGGMLLELWKRLSILTLLGFRFLRNVHIPTPLCNLIVAIYTDLSMMVLFKRQAVAMLGITSGVKHDCPLSGTLFALGLEPFVR